MISRMGNAMKGTKAKCNTVKASPAAYHRLDCCSTGRAVVRRLAAAVPMVSELRPMTMKTPWWKKRWK